MGAIWLYILHHTLAYFVIAEKLFRMLDIEMMRDHFFRRVRRTRVTVKDTVRPAKVRNVGFGRYAGTAEKNNTLMIL